MRMLDHCRMVRYGFPHKIPIATFVREYQCLLPDEAINGHSLVEIVELVVGAQGEECGDDCRIGTSSVYLREPLMEQLKQALAFTRNLAALIIQRNYKSWAAQRRYKMVRASAVKIQSSFRKWKATKSRQQPCNGLSAGDGMDRPGSVENGGPVRKKSACVPCLSQMELPIELQRRMASAGAGETVFKHSTPHYIPSTVTSTARQLPLAETVSIEEFAGRNIKVGWAVRLSINQSHCLRTTSSVPDASQYSHHSCR